MLWPSHAILVSDLSSSKKSSPLKLLSHLNRNLVGSIYMYGNQKQELHVMAMFVNRSGQNEQSL
jgi:hypothetical protein